VDALSSLRLLVTGGEAVEMASTLAWFDRMPAVPVVNTYGPTESVISTTSYLIDSPAEQRVPIGRPLGGRRVYVLDSVGGVVPVGVAGELCVGGAELARGYLGRPGLTAQRFVPDPYGGSGARMYRSGDRARWLPDGNLEFLGRFDDQVKLRGFRIELGEVQACLLSHRQVRAAVAAVRESAQGPRLVGYIVGEASPAQLVAWCAQSLPPHMVPTSVLVLEQLPLLPNGKINREALPQPPAADRSDPEFVAARTPTEDVIATICAEVLELDQVGVEHNFFALGGHSLRATVLASRLASAFGCVVKVRDVFEQPTVAALSVRVERLIIDEITAMSDEEIDLSLRGASSTPELS
jgi:acyl-CoA synthetase (AMP-forming)/AMP-acid ligase II/acyl carrier protein